MPPVIAAALEIVKTLLAWAKSVWERKHKPSVLQRCDQIAKDYDAKRKDLERR